jgi:hypothetical protein
MPMPARGKRIRVTARLPPDDFREAATRARNRGWSMSDYVAYCVAREVGSRRAKQHVSKTPLRYPTGVLEHEDDNDRYEMADG